MPVRKQNNPIQSAVNGLEQIPDGFIFKNDQVWVRLEPNLPAREKRALIWYYPAAALILISVGFAIFFAQTNHHPETIQRESINAVIKENIPVAEYGKQKNKIKISSGTNAKQFLVKETKMTAVVNEKPEIVERVPEKNIEPDASLMTPKTMDMTVTEGKDDKKPDEPTVAAVKPQLKKIRVIHLNELNKIVLPEFNAGRYDAKHPGFIPFEEIKVPAVPDKQILYFRIKTLPATTIVEN